MRRTLAAFAVVAGVLAGGACCVRAADGPLNRNLLDELNKQTTVLYRQAQTGIDRFRQIERVEARDLMGNRRRDASGAQAVCVRLNDRDHAHAGLLCDA